MSTILEFTAKDGGECAVELKDDIHAPFWVHTKAGIFKMTVDDRGWIRLFLTGQSQLAIIPTAANAAILARRRPEE